MHLLYFSIRNMNMNTMLKTKAIIPSLINVKKGIPSINKLSKLTLSRTILAAI